MLNVFFAVVRQSFAEPREAAGTLVSLGVPREVLWPAFLLMVLLQILFSSGMEILATASTAQVISPFVEFFVSTVVGLISVIGIWKVGEYFGGTGRFEESLLLSVASQLVFFVAQIFLLLVLAIVPGLALIFSMVFVVFILWVSLNYIAALHRFSSLWTAFGVLVFASIVSLIVFAILLRMFGIEFVGAA